MFAIQQFQLHHACVIAAMWDRETQPSLDAS